MQSSQTCNCKHELTISRVQNEGCPTRASLIVSLAIGLLVASFNCVSQEPVLAATSSETLESASVHAESQKSGSDALRQAAMEYAEACNFEHAKSKLEEDIALNQSSDKNRLPESWILMGNVYRLEGLYPEAKTWITRGVYALEKQKTTDPLRLSAAYNYLALFNNSAGEFSESEKNARRALSYSVEGGLGKENQAMHRVVLANALRQQGKYKEALTELESALPILKNGSERLLFATATNNLGALYFWMGDYQKALPILQDGLKQRLEIGGENHPDVANSYLDLGCVEFKMGDLKSALEHLEEAQEIRMSKLGANHPETLSSAANLGVVLLATGDIKRALELLKNAVEIGKTVLGNKNPDLAQYQDDYANALCADKQYDLARDIQNEANFMRKIAFGVSSREYAGGLRSLAQIESASGNKKVGRQLLQRSIAIYTAAAQHPDPDLAETLDELGCMYAESNELESARQTFALAIREKVKSGDSVSYATSLANLSELLHRMHQETESFVMLKKAAAAIESLPESQRENPDCKAILERYKKAQNGSSAGEH